MSAFIDEQRAADLLLVGVERRGRRATADAPQIAEPAPMSSTSCEATPRRRPSHTVRTSVAATVASARASPVTPSESRSPAAMRSPSQRHADAQQRSGAETAGGDAARQTMHRRGEDAEGHRPQAGGDPGDEVAEGERRRDQGDERDRADEVSRVRETTPVREDETNAEHVLMVRSPAVGQSPWAV